jgi:hypothetical protein
MMASSRCKAHTNFSRGAPAVPPYPCGGLFRREVWAAVVSAPGGPDACTTGRRRPLQLLLSCIPTRVVSAWSPVSPSCRGQTTHNDAQFGHRWCFAFPSAPGLRRLELRRACIASEVAVSATDKSETGGGGRPPPTAAVARRLHGRVRPCSPLACYSSSATAERTSRLASDFGSARMESSSCSFT